MSPAPVAAVSPRAGQGAPSAPTVAPSLPSHLVTSPTPGGGSSASGAASPTSPASPTVQSHGAAAGTKAAPHRPYTPDPDAYWRFHLGIGEVPILSGIVMKRKGLFTKRRELVLTSKPRLIYFDPLVKEKKGEIPWCTGLRVTVRSDVSFDVHTERRVYHLTCVDTDSMQWKGGIGGLLCATPP